MVLEKREVMTQMASGLWRLTLLHRAILKVKNVT